MYNRWARRRIMKLCNRILLPVLLTVLLLPQITFAQAYPDKPVRVILSFPPGGSTDIVGRIVFQKVTEITGQQFVIDNRGGAAGSIAAALVAKSPPDGYTILTHTATHLMNAHLMKLPYDTLGDFIGVTTMARQVFMLTVHPSMPVKSVKEFIALARKRPNEILYGTGGVGSALHLGMALFASMAGIKLVHVPYKGGGPAYVSLVAGHTQVSLPSVGSVLRYVKAKQMRPLGVTSDERIRQLPDVPAIAETVPGYEFTAWVGAYVPAGTPKPIVDKLNAEIKKALADPGVTNKLSSLAFDPMHMTPEQFSRRLKSDYEKYGKIIRESGAKNE
ncbi:MAG: hypothetical protein A3G24_16250 [Betaproteobacteria bacterium RIFCSPLOWO2_12_FULL_62_13]|nr:MAG: hypothetical protein A3G24_16250 [Betaproteobacteria bacterium RIFCSPLOWO2_12_FULL_62_13]